MASMSFIPLAIFLIFSLNSELSFLVFSNVSALVMQLSTITLVSFAAFILLLARFLTSLATTAKLFPCIMIWDVSFPALSARALV